MISSRMCSSRPRASRRGVPLVRSQTEAPSSRDRSPENGSTGPSSARPLSRASPKPSGPRGHGKSVTNRCNKVVDRLWAGNLFARATHDLEGRPQLRAGEHPRRPVPGHVGQEHPLQPVRGGHLGPHPLQEGQRADRRGGGQRRDRPGLRPGRRRVRHHERRGARERRAQEVPPDRDLRLRQPVRHRPRLLPVQLLPRPRGRRRRQGVCAAAQGHGGLRTASASPPW